MMMLVMLMLTMLLMMMTMMMMIFLSGRPNLNAGHCLPVSLVRSCRKDSPGETALWFPPPTIPPKTAPLPLPGGLREGGGKGVE